MCSDLHDETAAIVVDGVSKYFEMYDKPSHRLLQMLCRGRRQYYKPFWALTDISFSVARGECVGIIGRNGAGKSTLLQVVTGTLAPTSGEVRVNGRIAALLELGSGFNPEFTGRENVYLNASILGLTRAEIDTRYDDIVAFADIGEFIDQPVKSYSSGMVVRLAFAVVAHVNADVLIVDEALAVGDAFFTQKCMRFLRRFMETNTVLFVSHDAAAVNSLCNRAILLEHGHVKLLGSPKDVTETYMQDRYEAMQGKSTLPVAETDTSPTKSILTTVVEDSIRDMRQDFMNASNLRNDIQVFTFDPYGEAFGKGGCTMHDVRLTDEDGKRLNWVVGGEMVTLHIDSMAHQPVFSPIVGFHFKDRLGQILFGDNTFLSNMDTPLQLESGDTFSASFTFRMPVLPPGDYSICTAVAEGTQLEHVQHEWRHDALLISSISQSMCTGLMGIPMKSICLARNGH